MGLITAQATDLLELVFNNTDFENIGDATGLRGSTAAGSFYIALFTADPTATGSTANEATYTGYARVAVARNSGGFTISSTNVSNTAAITFGECTAGSNTITHFAIMTAISGGDMIIRGALSSSLAVSTSSNQIPEFSAGDLDVDATTTVS
jgi:hypothetical protein